MDKLIKAITPKKIDSVSELLKNAGGQKSKVVGSQSLLEALKAKPVPVAASAVAPVAVPVAPMSASVAFPVAAPVATTQPPNLASQSQIHKGMTFNFSPPPTAIPSPPPVPPTTFSPPPPAPVSKPSVSRLSSAEPLPPLGMPSTSMDSIVFEYLQRDHAAGSLRPDQFRQALYQLLHNKEFLYDLYLVYSSNTNSNQ